MQNTNHNQETEKMSKTTMTYEEWYRAVNRHVFELCELDTEDLPDCCYRDWYEGDVSPKMAAKKALRNAGWAK